MLAYKEGARSSMAGLLTLHPETIYSAWARNLCPEVVTFFDRVSLFESRAPGLTMLTNEAAITLTCLLKLISEAADR